MATKSTQNLAGFCWNSRRWLAFMFHEPNTCSHCECVYQDCDYYEERVPSKWYKYKKKILMSYK